MNKELVWFLLPLTSVLYMIGGTWWKLARRLFVGLTIGAFAVTFLPLSWWFLLLPFTYFVIFTLPITLIGDGVPEHWSNWIWLYILGFLLALASLPIALATGNVINLLWCSIPVAIIFGTVATLSNIKATAKIFTWKLCEFIFGVLAGLTPCLLIQ